MGKSSVAPFTLWWFRVQLYLQIFIQAGAVSFGDVLRKCFEHSQISGYDFSLIKPLYPLDTRISIAKFRDAGYVRARNLGCENLGTSTKEVLSTLLHLMRDESFCLTECGCGLTKTF